MIHCTLGYHYFGTSGLDTFANGVANGIYSNPVPFATPPVLQADFVATMQDFNTAAADYATYGATKKTTFLNTKKKLIDTLDLTADYVDSVAMGDESIIILAGYTPSSSATQSNIPLMKIDFFSLKRTTNNGEIVVEVPAISGHGTVNYFCICSEGAPLGNPTIVNGQITFDNTGVKVILDYNKPRKKLFSGLTAGVTYYFYVFASNTVSVSPLSDAKSIMAT